MVQFNIPKTSEACPCPCHRFGGRLPMPRDQAVMPYWVPQVLRPHKKVRGRLTAVRSKRDPEMGWRVLVFSPQWPPLEGSLGSRVQEVGVCRGRDSLVCWEGGSHCCPPSLLPPLLLSLLPPAPLPSFLSPPSPCLSTLSSSLGILAGRGRSWEEPLL